MEFSSKRFLREMKGLDANITDTELLNEVRQLVERKLVKEEVYDNLLNIHFNGTPAKRNVEKGSDPGVVQKMLSILMCSCGIDFESPTESETELGFDYTEWEKPVMEGKLVFYNEKERRARFKRADAVLYERRLVFFEPAASPEDSENESEAKGDSSSGTEPRKLIATVDLTEDSYVGDSNLKVFQDAGGNATGFVVGQFDEQVHLAADSKEGRSFWMHTIARAIRKLQDAAGFFDTPELIGQAKQSKKAKRLAFERRLEAYRTGVSDPQLAHLGVNKANLVANLRPHTGKYRKPVLKSSIGQDDPRTASLREGAFSRASARISRHPKSTKARETKSATVRVVVRRPVEGPNGIDENGDTIYDEHDEYHTLTLTTEEMEPAPADVLVVADVDEPTVSVVTDIGRAFNAYASDVVGAKEAALAVRDPVADDEPGATGESRGERLRRIAKEERDKEAEFRRLADAGHTPRARIARRLPGKTQQETRRAGKPPLPERRKARPQRHLHQQKQAMGARAKGEGSDGSGAARPRARRRGGRKSNKERRTRSRHRDKKKPASSGTSIRIPKDALSATMAEVRQEVQADWVAVEIDKLVKTIAKIGFVDEKEGGVATATFKQLFEEYNRAQSSALVGVLLRAKRKGVVKYVGDMLFQGHDDNVKITIKNKAKDFLVV